MFAYHESDIPSTQPHVCKHTAGTLVIQRRTCRRNVQIWQLSWGDAPEGVEVWPCRRNLTQLEVGPSCCHSGMQRDVLHAAHTLGNSLNQAQGALRVTRCLEQL